MRCVFELRGTLQETVIEIYRYCNLKFDNNTPSSSSSSVLINKNNDKDLVNDDSNMINHSFINHIIISMKNVKTILCNQVCYKFKFMSYIFYNIVYIVYKKSFFLCEKYNSFTHLSIFVYSFTYLSSFLFIYHHIIL